MRCYISIIRFATLAGVLCAASHFSFLWAQTAPIVLIQDSQGRQVYVNPSSTSSAFSFPKPIKTRRSERPSGLALAGSQLPVPGSIQNLVETTAGRFRVDPKLVDAIISVESEFNPHAVSPKGAEGLMQLIPATAERFGVADPFDSGQNIQGGVTFLRYLLDRFNGSVPLSLAAYNAGENRVAQDRDIPAIPETIDYVRRVTTLYQRNAARQAAGAGQAGGETPIYRYVDGWGVVHYTND
ncbi:MAG: lytic transglycosylase domain-containing protein [Terriglobia bacterium]